MVTLVVIFCMKLNPYMCAELRMVPDDLHAMATQGECLRGGAVGGMQFTLKNIEYEVKGWHCTAGPPDITAVSKWVERKKAELKRLEPQIK